MFFIRSFFHHKKTTADNPLLLILDGDSSQTKNLEVIIKASENIVSILSIPVHNSQKYYWM